MRFLASGRIACALVILTLASGAAGAQTLAHKGWAGSGLTVEPWWAGAVLYQVDPLSFQGSDNDSFGGLQSIIQRLDYLRELGVDAVVLSPFQLRPDFKASSGAPFVPKYGSEKDLAQLVQEASRRKIRIVVDLPLSASHSTQETLNSARFWLSRGVAGLRLTSDASARSSEAALTFLQLADRLKQLKRLGATYAGQRVLLWDLPEPVPGGGSTSRHSDVTRSASDGPQLVIDERLALMPKFDPSDLRNALVQMADISTTGENTRYSFRYFKWLAQLRSLRRWCSRRADCQDRRSRVTRRSRSPSNLVRPGDQRSCRRYGPRFAAQLVPHAQCATTYQHGLCTAGPCS